MKIKEGPGLLAPFAKGVMEVTRRHQTVWRSGLAAALAAWMALALTGCGQKEVTGKLDETAKDAGSAQVRIDGAEIAFKSTILLEVQEQGYDLSTSPDFTQPLSEEDRMDAGGALLPVYMGRDGQVVARLGCANTGNGELPTLEARVKSFEVFYGPCPADVEAPQNAKPRVAIGGVDFTGQDAEEVASLLEEKAGSVTSGEGPSPSQYTVGGCMYTFSFTAGGAVNRVWVQGL
ncbi:hypothetical protein HMPREF0262_02007 [Clostridium sp. ATCC 29733]|nr:hypothetical protein HMPREF0262_02007 [Clostridium sp. ATCC 29733]